MFAVLFPRGVGPTPVEGIEVTKPPWMFWWLFTLENWIGLGGIVWGTAVLFGLLAAVPFIDRNPGLPRVEVTGWVRRRGWPVGC